MGIDPANITDEMRQRMHPADRKQLGKRAETFAEAERRRVNRRESDIHEDFISFLNRHDMPFTHADPTRKSTIEPGTPDFFVGPRDNRGFYIEFKIAPNGLTVAQIQQIARLERNKNFVLVAVETTEGTAYSAAVRATAKFFNLHESKFLFD